MYSRILKQGNVVTDDTNAADEWPLFRKVKYSDTRTKSNIVLLHFVAWEPSALNSRMVITTPTLKRRSNDTRDSNMAARSTTSDYMNDRHQSYKCSLEGWLDHRRSARLRFRKVVDGEPVSSPDIEPAIIPTFTALDALKDCKDLAIDICCGNDPVSICAVQDIFFAFVDRIPEVHCLRSLNVSITVVLPNDINERSWVVSDVWPSAFLHMPTIYENKTIQPGDLSRMHMIVFLIDPLRKIRALGGEGKIKEVELIFAGRTGEVWKEILDVVKDLVCGKSVVEDYEVFRRYFDGVKHLIKSMRKALKNISKLQDKAVSRCLASEPTESLASSPAPVPVREVIDLTIEAPPDVTHLTADAPQVSLELMDLRMITKALAMARIRGSFEDLSAGHADLLRMADEMIVRASSLPGDEHFVSLFERLQQNMEYAASIFPKKVDVSHYGYNESDAKLAEYRSDPEGYVLRRAKLKRKRKRTRGQDA